MKSRSEIAARLGSGGHLDSSPHAVLVYDLDFVGERLQSLRAAFPAGALHALALKACPLAGLLREAVRGGFGAEAASEPELEHALRLGFPADRIVFDSPAKTESELRLALRAGVHVNADSLQELERIDDLVESLGVRPSVGVRVNPGLRPGRIEATSTATPGSKFGVSLADHRDALLAAFARFPWLRGLHVHAGSQGGDLELLVEAVGRVADLAAEIDEAAGAGRLRVFDLGGGLSVTYRAGDRVADFGDYAAALRERAPDLFSGRWSLVTEFGRAVWANAATAFSRVEYTKTSHGRRIAVQHLGADLLVRPAYVPEQWSHEISAYDAAGREKGGPGVPQDVAGPLCFSGDLVARGRELPPLEPGDIVAIHDVGAYTLSMWSRYNSRRSPAVLGYSRERDSLTVLRAAESIDDVLRFWR